MPVLETSRLIIRPFQADDLEAAHRLMRDLGDDSTTLEERRAWLTWVSATPEQLGRLIQPPYGDRAAVRREDGRLIGSCGLVPSFGPFGLIPSLRDFEHPNETHMTPEVGLYYAFEPAARRQGYATEAAKALIDYGFTGLELKRVIATTTYNNAGSIGVMRRLGMTIERNPNPDPFWFQIVGVLANPN